MYYLPDYPFGRLLGECGPGQEHPEALWFSTCAALQLGGSIFGRDTSALQATLPCPWAELSRAPAASISHTLSLFKSILMPSYSDIFFSWLSSYHHLSLLPGNQEPLSSNTTFSFPVIYFVLISQFRSHSVISFPN